jgi:adenine-specific DNA methylase/very-short-patch-repair endonuclease
MRFGHRPKVADTFCGGGSIPFEAARLGCDVYASDLNPVACMLTWAALNIIGADAEKRKQIAEAQKKVAEAVDAEITALGIEHNSKGDRAKVFLYCLETRCPQTSWLIPMAPSWVISVTHRVCAKLVPNHEKKRFEIEVVTSATLEEMEQAKQGTVRDGNLIYQLNDQEYITSIKTIRGDRKVDNEPINDLRKWEKLDFVPRPDDILQERLYCIQWIKPLHPNSCDVSRWNDDGGKSRQVTYFASVTEEDLEREQKIRKIVGSNLEAWQAEGLVPDMEIEAGEKTDEPIRTRGWTYWHHLFNPRQLLLFKLYRQHLSDFQDDVIAGALTVIFTKSLDWSSRLTRWNGGLTNDKVENVFSNQALNTLFNYGTRGHIYLKNHTSVATDIHSLICGESYVYNHAATEILYTLIDVHVNDPPYADAIHYHEITEYFIAWLRKNPPEPFKDWIWDSRRKLSIQGSGDDFRREMARAYAAMTEYMPDNGMQVIMFTHQGVEVWADMALIVWGAGLRVVQAWYIATETTSELKKGGYVQGTVLMVVRKRQHPEQIYKDELVIEIRQEVERQINIMLDLNRQACPHPPSPPLPIGEGGTGVLLPSPYGRGAGGEGISQLAGQARRIPEALLQRARELRRQQTPTESILWECLRDRRLLSAKFRRQHNIGQYIADFYCHDARLVIELDGAVHQTQQDRDIDRDEWMQANGFRVLRFTNPEVEENLEIVLEAIAANLPSPSQPPSPQGEGGAGETGLPPSPRGRGVGGEGFENLFEDADLYMAGYAAALKVLTSYTHIGSTDMTQAALRPRQAGQDSFVDEMVELARNIAGQILVPEGLYSNDPKNAAKLWEKLAGSDRFYLKMLDLEATDIHKLDNYQNFAKAFKVDYAPLMGNQKPNAARLKSALEFKKAEVAGFEFERSIVRSILYALYQLQMELETDLVLDQFWDNCRGRFNLRDREDIHHLCNYIALKLKDIRPEEASAARVFAGLLKTEHL